VSDWSQVVARKALGQHFLHDERVLARIADLAKPEPGSGLLEIGPGTGNLTAHLVKHGSPLIAVERDRRLPALLQERFGDSIEVMRADATKVDYERLLRREQLGPAPVVVGNLPYNVGTEIMFRVLQGPLRPKRIVFMLQREVALRLVANPSTSAYGLLTIKVGIRADVKLALRVRPGAFTPPPRVESAVVVIEPLAQLRHKVPSYERLCLLLNAGFGLRRKTLSNALRNRLGIDVEPIREALQSLDVDVRSRAETLSIAQWAALATALDPHIPANATGRRARKPRKS
jgi:16S rRNA (adenine1518-N6/adenine1519-N6)-dimethyltransferase